MKPTIFEKPLLTKVQNFIFAFDFLISFEKLHVFFEMSTPHRRAAAPFNSEIHPRRGGREGAELTFAPARITWAGLLSLGCE